MRTKELIGAAFVSLALLVIIAAMTNRLDIENHSWDFRYYIAMAEQGFDAKPLVSPFAYRYPTPFIAAYLSSGFGISLEWGFRVIAYAGAMLQLLGVFWFVRTYAASIRGAYVALVAVAFSLIELKFLIFDVYRPDHLAYAFILLELYFCLTRRVYPLILTAMLGVQFREFAVLPLIAYPVLLISDGDWRALGRAAPAIVIGLAVAVGLPRLLIPVTDTIQSVSGYRSLAAIPLDLKRDLNLVFCIASYFLPSLILVTRERFRTSLSQLPADMVRLLAIYAVLVFCLSLYGGTDMMRFVTYFFVVQAIFLGMASRAASPAELLVTLGASFVFNKIWLPFPVWDMDKYLDFYAGYDSRLNAATLLRLAEGASFIILGILLRRVPAGTGRRGLRGWMFEAPASGVH